MELRHLRYFLAVAEELNFTRAAERLGISQPPLTQQVKALEAELGVTLLDRSAYRIELTDAGRIFAAEAARILGDARSAMQAARRAATGVTGRVRVGFTESASFNSLVTSTLQQVSLRLSRRGSVPRRAPVHGSHRRAARGAHRCRFRAAAGADPARADPRSAGEGAAARGRAERPSPRRPAGDRSRLTRGRRPSSSIRARFGPGSRIRSSPPARPRGSHPKWGNTRRSSPRPSIWSLRLWASRSFRTACAACRRTQSPTCRCAASPCMRCSESHTAPTRARRWCTTS